MLLKKAAFVAGVDRSPDVVAAARTRFKRDVELNKATFVQGSVEHLPFQEACFTRLAA